MIHKEDSNFVVYYMKNWILSAETPPAGNLASFLFLISQVVALIGLFRKKNGHALALFESHIRVSLIYMDSSQTN